MKNIINNDILHCVRGGGQDYLNSPLTSQSNPTDKLQNSKTAQVSQQSQKASESHNLKQIQKPFKPLFSIILASLMGSALVYGADISLGGDTTCSTDGTEACLTG
ncbi:hypothetical protein, partial [Helicobacter sp. 11S02596-1]|uniref:hypothetical protein n=1 Tax=Helicobacter sp. 11S02596-1 TaxID=1476194 RepID=UPI00117A51D1